MESETEAPRILTRDRAVTLGALGLLVALSWTYLLRAPRHSHEMVPLAAVTPPGAPGAPSVPELHPEEPESPAEDGVEEYIPRFP